MKTCCPPKFDIPCSAFNANPVRRRAGFTLVEVVLVLVLTLVISSISLPYFAHAYKGTQLRTAARTITRMTRYARSMAIMREELVTIALNHETLEVFLGAASQTSTNAADGKLDQEVLKRLGYVEGSSTSGDAGIEKEIHRFLPESLTVREFKKDWREEDDRYEDLYLVRYFPDGQSEWFVLELEDQHGDAVRLENDPISGKLISEFVQ